MKKKDNPEMVNHPDHYNNGKFEVIEVLEDWAADDPLIWQTLKYIGRHKHKGKPLEDLKKAKWHLDRKISQMEAK
jgi:hypothetical protein